MVDASSGSAAVAVVLQSNLSLSIRLNCCTFSLMNVSLVLERGKNLLQCVHIVRRVKKGREN